MLKRALTAAFAEAHKVTRGATATHRHLRDRLVAVGVVTLVIDLIASGAILAAEHDAGPRTEITNYGDALFWTSAQLLTVSSQMANPLTTWGRILDIGLEAYAITVVAALAGSFGAFFHRRGHERDPLKQGT